ncbi:MULTISPECIES: hypothetical protein [Halarchaeum]|uniref:Uncharacterized protein n=1 Tax=Halarchaeum grantii TaxID=1193105 RepID=A0A830F305_9EURY|nr:MULTISPECIES: hypothetical protein [Halarchaeum]GGL35610.1 hypothetical protein GCM10009037_19100 [Halarchaeum grantii]
MALFPSDPMFYVLLALVLGFVFFCYLLLRRTLLSFREGKGGR